MNFETDQMKERIPCESAATIAMEVALSISERNSDEYCGPAYEGIVDCMELGFHDEETVRECALVSIKDYWRKTRSFIGHLTHDDCQIPVDESKKSNHAQYRREFTDDNNSIGAVEKWILRRERERRIRRERELKLQRKRNRKIQREEERRRQEARRRQVSNGIEDAINRISLEGFAIRGIPSSIGSIAVGFSDEY